MLVSVRSLSSTPSSRGSVEPNSFSSKRPMTVPGRSVSWRSILSSAVLSVLYWYSPGTPQEGRMVRVTGNDALLEIVAPEL